MKMLLKSTMVIGIFTCVGAFAGPPAGAPVGTMGVCNDGSYSSSAEKKGACRGHKGVKEWYEVAAPAAPVATATTTATTPAASTTTTKTTTTTAGGRMAPAPMSVAPGGGNGNVWSNTSTKVYHCSGDKYYGKTKHGEYMSEADAKAKGYHADHGKACS